MYLMQSVTTGGRLRVIDMERPLTTKFDPSRTPSKLYTEYAKPALVVEQNHHIVPSNIQSYLDNTEPIYQNEAPKKFYELVTPQKFTKPVNSPIKTSESFKSPFVARPEAQVPSSPDVKEEKKKKWSLGGLFRRRKKGSESESSSQEEDQKLGFLARRRSRREKRKQRKAAGFDVVIKPRQTTPVELSPDSLKTPELSPGSLTGSHDRLYSSSEGLSRRERRSVIKQRAEALRPRGSSSDESTSLHRSGSLNRRSRYARTERYIKRLSREEEAVLAREAVQRGYIDSATPSPGQSPQVRPRIPHHPSLSNPASLERRAPAVRSSKCNPLPPHQRSLSYDNDIHRINAAPSYDNGVHRLNTAPSYDNEIHRLNATPTYDNESHHLNSAPSPESVMIVQFPVARLFQGRKPGPPPPPPRDPMRRVTPQDPGRPMSYAFDDTIRRTQGGSFLSLNNQPMSSDMTRTNSVEQVRQRQRPASVTPVGRRQAFQYFADQTPRSRKPIHIQASPEPHHEPMSDSQAVVIKPPPSRHPVSQASEFWRQKELEAQRSPSLKVKSIRTDSLSSLGSDASTESLERRKERPLSIVVERPEVKVTAKLKCLPNARFSQSDGLKPADGTPKTKSPQDVRVKVTEITVKPVEKPKLSALKSNPISVETCPKFMSTPIDYSTKALPEPRLTSPAILSSSHKLKSTYLEPASSSVPASSLKVMPTPAEYKTPSPPAPPVRRFSRQLSSSSLEEPRQSNLEEALDELEAIYQSLRLGDEDLLDRAERRDLPTKFQLRESLPGSMSDSGYDLTPNTVRRRAPPSKRSGIPDKVTDDMAYRRLHPKDRPNSQNIVSQAGSFLLTSPVLSQASSITHLDQDHSSNEPDITFDDVVYRNIRHANNTLKISDTQLPFGIPIGPVTPSPNSDYLHSKPSERYRPTFKPRRTPDVVNDDLAYRNLRKDNSKESSLLTAVETALHNARLKDSNFSLRKRRAVRSLSANLPSLIGQDKTLSIIDINPPESSNFEKAQSLTHLPDALEIAAKILEGKEVIGGGSSHRWANGSAKSSDRNSLGMSTSTETLTDSRANLSLCQDNRNKRNSWQQKLRVNIPTEARLPPSERRLDQNVLPPASVDTSQASTTESSPVLKTTIYEHSGGLPIPDSVPGSPLDEAQLEDLLSALAREARVTSEQLGRQLAGFEAKVASEQHAKKLGGFEAKVASEHLAKQRAGYEARVTSEDISDDSLDSFCRDLLDAKSLSDMEQPKPASKNEIMKTADKIENTKPTSIMDQLTKTTSRVEHIKSSSTDDDTKQTYKDETTKPISKDEHIKPTPKDDKVKPSSKAEPTKPISKIEDTKATSKVVETKTTSTDEDATPKCSPSKPVVEVEIKPAVVEPVAAPRRATVESSDQPNPRIASIINEMDPSVTLDEFITSFHVPVTAASSSAPLEPLHIYESDSEDQEVEAILSHGRREEGGASKEGTSTRMRWLGQEPRHVLMACTYCIACTQQMIGLDWLTALGILLAIVALLALIMLYR